MLVKSTFITSAKDDGGAWLTSPAFKINSVGNKKLATTAVKAAKNVPAIYSTMVERTLT